MAAVKPGPDLPGEPELPVLVHADRDRPEVAGVTLAGRPAADDQLLLRPDLQLEPGRRPASRLVPRSAELGDDALEPLAASRLHERLALAHDVCSEPDPGRLLQHRAQESFAVLERHAEQRSSVEVEQIERLVDERAGRRRAASVPDPPLADPLLEQGEVGPAGLVERNDLAVDDRLVRVDPASAARGGSGSRSPRPSGCGSRA